MPILRSEKKKLKICSVSIQEELRQRRFGTPVRLEVSPDMPEEMIEYLTSSLDLEPDDVYVFDGPLHLQDLMSLYDSRSA